MLSHAMIHPKVYRNLRKDIEENTKEYLDKAKDFVIKHLDWNYNEEYIVRVRKLNRQKFIEIYKVDRLAGQCDIDEKTDEIKGYFIDLNWEKLTNTENKAFVLEFAYCIVHELLEIYRIQTGNRLTHLPPNEEERTPEEMEITYRFSEDVLRIPRGEWYEYRWDKSK